MWVAHYVGYEVVHEYGLPAVYERESVQDITHPEQTHVGEEYPQSYARVR